VFVETITTSRDEWEHWNERLRTLTEPPEALVASIAWRTDDANITVINVWDSPEAVADFFVERVHPIVEAEGEPASKPIRHGEPVAVYLRGAVRPT
jgi:hypothetical protein